MKQELKVKQLLDLVIKDYRDNDKSSLANVVVSISHIARHGLEDQSAERLKTADIEEYKDKRRAKGAAQATINIELSHLRWGYTLALERELINKKPLIKTYQIGNKNRRLGFFEREEYEKQIAALKPYQKQCLRFSYFCGWGEGELFKLTWKENYDEDNQCIRIYNSKNGDGRVLPLFDEEGEPTELYDIIEEQKTYRVEDCPWIFHYKGRRLNRSTFNLHWRKAKKVSGVERHFHDTRRTASRNLRNAGADQAERMAIIGHRTVTMDLRYGIVNMNDIKASLGKLGRHQKKKKGGNGSGNGSNGSSAPKNNLVHVNPEGPDRVLWELTLSIAPAGCLQQDFC